MSSEAYSGYQIRLMDEPSARAILNWKYEPPYSLYNMMDDSAETEDIEELMDGSYFNVRTAEENWPDSSVTEGMPRWEEG